MTKEKLFEFAKEKGWHEILKVACENHSLSGIASKLNKKEINLHLELRAMQSLGLLELLNKTEGGYRYVPTVLGIKFLQEENKKAGRTFSCLLCGTTTGIPHLCPCFFPQLEE